MSWSPKLTTECLGEVDPIGYRTIDVHRTSLASAENGHAIRTHLSASRGSLGARILAGVPSLPRLTLAFLRL